MLTPLTDLPAGVIGFEASGQVGAEDYSEVLAPAVEEARRGAGGKVRLVYVLGPDFTGFSPGAALQDARIGLAHPLSWERVALVSDLEWMRHMTNAMSWLIPGELRGFPLAEREQAIAWAAG